MDFGQGCGQLIVQTNPARYHIGIDSFEHRTQKSILLSKHLVCTFVKAKLKKFFRNTKHLPLFFARFLLTMPSSMFCVPSATMHLQLERSDKSPFDKGVFRRNVNTRITKKESIFSTPFFVIPLGLEPKTYSLEGCCSIQLSYGTKPYLARNRKPKNRYPKAVEPISGFEPETPSLRVKCSTAELNRHLLCDFAPQIS